LTCAYAAPTLLGMGFLRKAMDLKAAHTQNARTAGAEIADRRRFELFKPSNMVNITVRVPPSDKAKLVAYFDQRRIPLSTGIRFVVANFIAETVAPE